MVDRNALNDLIVILHASDDMKRIFAKLPRISSIMN